MKYKIGQIAEKLGLTAHTLRFYDKEGLLPFVKKNSAGFRVFDENDVDWLIVIECLKATGMPLKNIKKYIDLCQVGDETLKVRLEMFQEQKKQIEKQMIELQQYMEKINFKIAYYTEAVKYGSSDVYERNKWLAQERERIFKHK